MDKDQIKKLLEDVQNKKLDIDSAMQKFKNLPYDDLNFAKIDTHRAVRRGFPEVVFCQGKTIEQVVAIMKKMSEYHEVVLGMRASEEMFQAVKQIADSVEYDKLAKALIVGKRPSIKYKGTVLVCSGGTADMPVAEEAAITAEMLGNKVEKLYDAGVAGIHRLFSNKDKIDSANVVVAVAGMEGALPGVVASLIDKPVIAVPTSVGYGANFQGVSALLTMLNSCVPGISVVNIDNGFGAGYMASLINRLSGEL